MPERTTNLLVYLRFHSSGNGFRKRRGELLDEVKDVLRRIKHRLTKLTRRPRVGHVTPHDLWSPEPISRRFGMDRGTPIDRYYISRFIGQNRSVIKGRVMEIADAKYSRMFGDEVTEYEVLHVEEGNPRATIVGDLTNAPQIPDNSFDCIILTQTLQFIFEVDLAIQTVHRILRPGGAVLTTVAGISQVSAYDMTRWGDYWRFTNLSIRKLFEKHFSPEQITVGSFGNVLTSTLFLHGLAVEEIPPVMLEKVDPTYELVIGIRAVK